LFEYLPEDYPDFVISIKTDGHPINLKILNRMDYMNFVKGKSYKYWNGGKYMLEGDYTMLSSQGGFMCLFHREFVEASLYSYHTL
jgi:hypothetical protein